MKRITGLYNIPLCICGCGEYIRWNKWDKKWVLFVNGGHSRRGKKHNKAVKQKVSKANKGRLVGEKNPNFGGKAQTEEVRKKMSEKKGERCALQRL